MVCRLRPLLPDRQLLPRRGPAGRPPAGVHADRPRDVVRDRGPGLLDARAADGRLMALIGRDAPQPFLPHALRRGDREVRIRQAGSALRHGDQRPLGRFRGLGVCRLPDDDRGRRRGPRIRRAGRRAGTRAASSTSSSSRRSSSGRAGLVWARAAEGAVQSSALKAAGEDAIRRALETREAPGPPTCC